MKKVEGTEEEPPSLEEKVDLPVHKLDSKEERPIFVKVLYRDRSWRWRWIGAQQCP